MKIKVGINGYGTIGKRVADAVLLQDDMELVGITANSYNYRIGIAHSQGIHIYRIKESFSQLKTEGNLKDLLKKIDVIVDCSPKPNGSENIKNFYAPHNVKAIIQGGEKAQNVEASFVAQCNYEKSLNKNYVRVVSCNTTGLSRSIHALDQAFGVIKAHATLIRRGGDPANVTRGPINAIIPSFELPSHHGPDVCTIIPGIKVFTTAVIVPTTLMHMHNLSVRLKKNPKTEDIIKLFADTPRIRVINADHKLASTAEVMELAKDIGNKRGDMSELCVWENGIGIHDDELFFPQAVHQESIVTPENIDAIRAVMGIPKEVSMRKTDKSLCI